MDTVNEKESYIAHFLTNWVMLNQHIILDQIVSYD